MSVKTSAKKIVKKVAKKALPKIELTDRQRKVLAVVKKHGKVTLAFIAKTAFPDVRPALRANSWARNQVRDLRALKFVKKVARGTYAARP